MKTYSTKAAAKKGAKRNELNIDELNFIQNEEGRWMWEEKMDKVDLDLMETCGHTHCPHCDIHLSNGLQDFENMLDAHNNQSEIEPITHEFLCLGCGEEFGEERELPTKGTGIKIEKDRPEQNGIQRPSAGGKCRAIWDFCDELNEKGVIPMPKMLKEAAAEKGWNENNAVIEMYQWRKFHGIVGRQK